MSDKEASQGNPGKDRDEIRFPSLAFHHAVTEDTENGENSYRLLEKYELNTPQGVPSAGQRASPGGKGRHLLFPHPPGAGAAAPTSAPFSERPAALSSACAVPNPFSPRPDAAARRRGGPRGGWAGLRVATQGRSAPSGSGGRWHSASRVPRGGESAGALNRMRDAGPRAGAAP